MTNMVSTDPIADMLSRIRNAIAAGKSDVELPHSKLKELIAKTLVDNLFLEGLHVKEEDGRKYLLLSIRSVNENAKITEITRLSKPGRRVYVRASQIPSIKRGRGLIIISTSAGIMTGELAKSKGLGGELICQVY